MTAALSEPLRALKLIAVGFLSIVLVGVGKAEAASAVEGPIFDPYSDTDLYVLPLSTWSEAEADAESFGGTLMTISSVAENTFVVDNVLKDFSGSGGPNLSDLPLWIGLYDPTGAASDDGPGGSSSQHAANFGWIDGSDSTYRNWNSNTSEPTDTAPGEYYTVINWHFAHGDGVDSIGTWNDTPDGGTTGLGGNTDGPYYGIAEVDVPEPTTLTFLAGGFILLLGAYRRGETKA